MYVTKHKKLNVKADSQVEPASAPALGRFVAGVFAASVALAASLMLVLEHLFGLSLPGCGVGSPCAALTATAWGKVPVLGWPTSFAGLAYFTAAVVGWILCRAHGVPASFKWIVRVGAALSVMFLAVIAVKRQLCPYCLIAHVGNLTFWIIVESAAARAGARPTRFSPAIVGLIFAAALIGLVAVESGMKERIAQREAREHAESTQEIIKHTHSANQARPPAVTAKPFTGRYRFGPENAPIRIVIISDYQCVDCKRIEAQARQIMQTRTDVSVSAKHFPMCAACNRFISDPEMHENACWAARAAETAGLLRGNDGFWKMHFWLFEHDGVFITQQDLDAGLIEQGYNEQQRQQFRQMLGTDQVLQPILADIEEAHDLGLYFTPMIFINGVELRGFRAPNALINAVTALAATNPPPGSPTQDQPVAAPEKYIGDWREQPLRAMPPDGSPRALGPESARVKVVVWGNYQSNLTAELDRAIRGLMESRGDIRYTFRHYPFDELCNPSVKRTQFPHDCKAAALAEAAGALGGNDAYFKAHDWLLSHQAPIDDAAIKAAAAETGLDEIALREKIQAAETLNAIHDDIRASEGLIPQGVPTLYVNGRLVLRWRLEGHDILKRIVEEAGK